MMKRPFPVEVCMFTAHIAQSGTVFHEYEIRKGLTVVHRLRADPKEVEAVVRVFEVVALCAQNQSSPFPFAVVHNPDSSACLCGPKDAALNWGPLLVGPAGMLDGLLPSLIETFNTHHPAPGLKIKC